MQALFTGGLGDFIGAECFMTELEKDSVTTVLWATRNREEIRSVIDLKTIFPNMIKERILFDDFCNERPTRDWQPGDQFMNIGRKHELNLKCNLNLTQEELDSISDHSLDATLEGIFNRSRSWQTSRIADKLHYPLPNFLTFPEKYVVIHPWSDSEINGREFDNQDWNNIFQFLEDRQLIGIVVNQSEKYAPVHPRLIDLTNRTSLKETFGIIKGATYCILCASSLACYATKIFPKGKIWLKGGWPHMFTDWATYFYHGPFVKPNDIIFKDLGILNLKPLKLQSSLFDQGYVSLL